MIILIIVVSARVNYQCKWWVKFEYNLTPEDGVLRYRDSFSRWKDNNPAGRNLLTEHVTKAYKEGLVVRLVIVKTKETEIVNNGADASRIKKHFYVKETFEGKVTTFDGDNYIIDYKMLK